MIDLGTTALRLYTGAETGPNSEYSMAKREFIEKVHGAINGYKINKWKYQC